MRRSSSAPVPAKFSLSLKIPKPTLEASFLGTNHGLGKLPRF
jgi:hypothetical protein